MMPQPETTKTFDAALVPYLEAPDRDEAERLLGHLLSEQAEPVITGIIRNKLRASLRPGDGSADNQNALDVRSDVQTQLLAELNALRMQPESKIIGNFRSYVAVVTYHACYEHLRQKYPQRHSLKNKLRYFLTHQPDLALWENERRELVAGRAEWNNGHPVTLEESVWQNICAEPLDWAAAAWPGRAPNTLKPGELLRGLFDAVHGPVELDDLVGVCASIWGVRDVQEESNDEATEQYGDRLPDQNVSVATKVEQKEYLSWLWQELSQLPVRQRAALLLNLRDAQGRGVIALLPLTGIATLRQIAEALEIPALKFAEIWSQLPLDDATIATRLGLTRQQVINLRKAARERLMRRMKRFET